MRWNRHTAVLIFVALVAILVDRTVRRDQAGASGGLTPEQSGAGDVSIPEPADEDAKVARPLPGAEQRVAHLPPSPLDRLGPPEATAEDDVRLLAMLFADYASVFKQVPLGMHTEIVSAFRGDNPRKIQYIPEGHPAVDSAGQIVDRWDEPYFFHVISKDAVEIISSGADRLLFTEDDIRYRPPNASVEPEIDLTMRR